VPRKSGGLQWRRVGDEIRRFVAQHGANTPRRAIFCTYDFDIRHFELKLFPLLDRPRRPFTTLVLADRACMRYAKYAERQRFGRYQFSLVHCAGGGVFHPKVILLMCGHEILAGIGSSNLTEGGLGGNFELMHFERARLVDKPSLAGGVVGFLRRLAASHSVLMPESARRFISHETGRFTHLRGTILDSLDESLFDQMAALSARTSSVHVVTPWHSAGADDEGVAPPVVSAIAKRSAAPVTVYTESLNGAAPRLGAGVVVRTLDSDVRRNVTGDEREDAETGRIPSRLHAKLYLYSGNARHVAFIGSANCTQPALMRPVEHGGNVEILAALQLDDRHAKAIKRDLASFFTASQKTVAVTPPKRRRALSGCVLGAEVQATQGQVNQLHVYISGDGTTSIANAPGGKAIPITPSNAVAVITDRRVLDALFPRGVDHGTGSILYERVEKHDLPFPVSWPLTPIGSTAVETLEDITREEMGLLPLAIANGGTRTEDDEERDDDGDLDQDQGVDGDAERDLGDLTRAKHQGELDRLAVALTIFRRRLVRGRYSKAYMQARVDDLVERLRECKLPDHLVTVVEQELLADA